MDPDRWQRLISVFDDAVEVSPDVRASFIRSRCGGDEDLAGEVERMLAAHDRNDGFMSRPAFAVAALAEPRTELGYRIIRTIGSGGMGVVYLAEQLATGRMVALKVVGPWAASESLVRRFEFEVRTLARLQHPAIAQVYEAGTLPESEGKRPFFAMELVDGKPLNTHIQERSLDTRERLGLFLKICDGVQFAHQKGIIHRDLKPANILVTEAGLPKILDFGVARVTGDDPAYTGLHTRDGQLVGTLAYMSPEQVSGDVEGLDTRSDVYALGVLLHEVLCGRPPYDIRHKNLAEAARVIREEDPSTLGSFDRSLRGDLDVIAGKCLAKEKERRYGSVAELAADVTRHLCDEPILARPAGTWYQVSKFAHRNKVAVAGGIAVLAALILGMIGTTWQAIRATHANKETDKARAGERAQLAKAIGEQKAAKEQADASQAVVEFIRRMLISVEPDNLGREAKVVDLLSYADQNLDRELGGQPEAWYTLRNTLASSFISLGRQAEAEREINVLLDRAGRDGRTNDRQLWNARNALGVVRNAQGKSKEALEIYRECIEAERSDSSWPTLEMIQTLENYGLALQELGRLAESERALREAKDLAQSKLGDTHRETLTAKVNLATTLGLIGKVQESRAIIAAEIPKLEETIGVDGEMTLVAIEQLAKQESSAGNALAAERGFRRVYDTRMRIYGERHPQTLVAMSNLGDVLRLLKRLPEAQLMTERALALRREILGPEHPQTLSTQHSYSQLLSALGRFQEAAELCEHTLESRIALLGEDHPITLTTMNNLAMTYVDLKRLDDGLRRIDRVIELRTKVLGPEHWQTIKSREVRAEMFQRCGKPAESEAALRELIGPATEALKENHSIVVSIRCYHARCLRDLKRLDECERELLGLRQMLDANGVKGEDGRSITVNRNLVALYTAWDKPEKAEPYRSPGTP